MHGKVIGASVVLSSITILALSNTVLADGVSSSPLDALQAEYPGVQVHQAAPRVRALYGRPMTAGGDPVEAAEAFLAAHQGALGSEGTDLILDWTCDVNFGKFTVFNYRQEIAGLPVEYGQAVVLVSNALNRVVYASGTLASAENIGDIGVDAAQGVDPQEAVDALSVLPAWRHRNLTEWSEPEMVVFFGEDRKGESHVTWRITGENPDPVTYDAYTFFIDVATGDLVHVRHEGYDIDVVGSVEAMATPGELPDLPTNPPATLPVPEVRVDRSGGGNAYTDHAGGNFVIPYAGTGGVTVSTGIANARWVTINDNSGTPLLTDSESGTAGTPISLLLNPTPSEFTTAQANVARYVAITRSYIVERAPGYNALQKITANVNRPRNCDARYFSSNQSINFDQRGGGCNNTAFSGVISHEYGHYLVNRRGLSQGSFGEGFSDSVAAMILDSPVNGPYFLADQPYLRHPIIQNVQYPCPGEIHYCGMVVSGVWWRIKEAFQDKYGEALGLELARQLHVDWYLITAGGVQNDGMHPMSAIEVLTLNDDDGDFSTGVPDFTQICGAFAAHSISCPVVEPLSFVFPDGVPEMLTPGASTQIRVHVGPLSSTPIAGTGEVHWSVNGGTYQTAAMAEGAPGEYTATLPAFDCPEAVAFYFTADSPGGEAVNPPEGAGGPYLATATAGNELVFEDDFETNKGWLVTGVTNGKWERGVPVNDPSWDYDPVADGDGSGQCFLTENALGNTDVDNGSTTLYSPAFDLSVGGVRVSFWYYLNITTPGLQDGLGIEISQNGLLGPWTELAFYNQNNGTEWTQATVTQGDLVARNVTPGSNMMLRFVATDPSPAGVVEAGIDGVRVEVADCAVCYADCDQSTSLDLFDVLCYLNLFNAGAPSADCEQDESLDLFDVLCFLNAFNEGCQ